jgi:predicted DNA binding CopG/RHH family protein
MKLGNDEKRMVESFGREEWQSSRGARAERRRFGRYAKAMRRKERRVSIRISTKDLQTIKKRALGNGVTVQVLLSELLHKYAVGLVWEPRRRN